METFNEDPKPGRLVLPLVLIGMIATTYTFINRVASNNDLEIERNPILLDAGLLSAVIINGITNNYTYLPVSADEVELYSLEKPYWAHSTIIENNIKYVVINVEFYNKDFIKVGHYINYRANNVSNYELDSNYYIDYKRLEIIENNTSNEAFIFGNNHLNLQYKNLLLYLIPNHLKYIYRLLELKKNLTHMKIW